VPIAPVIPPNVLLPFQGATQRVRVSGSLFPVAFDSGFLHLNLNTTVIPAGDVPPTDPAAAQAWITTFMSVFKSGHYDVGYRAVRLDTAFGALHRHPPQ
jgi:hypothetical protein